MLTPEQDKRRKRRLAEQYNPELSLGEPGEKRRSKGGLAERTTIASAEEVKEGVRRMQNDSKKTSKDSGSDDNLAFAGGWGQILGEVFASTNESPELKETRASFNGEYTKDSISPKKEELKKSGNLVDFIIEYEDFSSTPYDDFKQTSIGYGTKATSKNQTITKAEAKVLLKRDLDTARKAVLKMKEEAGYDWNENQIDALTSFTYNLGPSNLKKLTENGTRGDEEIADMLPEYKYAGGKVREGLIKRREAELKLFNEGYTK
jgi:GH24 family phage-related lysozyme (muramidase)